ncbi:hypothetical protein GARC_2757 [Paraglaciecola arctica BSs20135]|uniref:Uncharacterized protein n=1 Tax=Paraglaciecola arctica BSs20135 TaxID=493475 RepID=K6YNG6_9ALTE|nr:hypothetical protein GARC_2757 [Paraglaciecola arctica BSs20135]
MHEHLLATFLLSTDAVSQDTQSISLDMQRLGQTYYWWCCSMVSHL